MTIEEGFEEIEGLINELEKKDITLEESFSKYQEGIKLIKECNGMIDRIEKEIIVLEENKE